MSQKIGVVALTATGSTITLYLDSGDTKELSSGSYRTKQIVDEILPIVARKETAYVDLDSYSLTAELEKKSNGVLRFFRRVKNAVKSAIGLETSAHINDLSERAQKVLEQTAETARPAINHPDELLSGETMVAVVDGQEIEGVEALASQMEAAVSGDAKGLTNFLKRLAAVAKERKHTADELLRFMKKGDLPIADDGSIIAYKMLYAKTTTENGVQFDFVDPHSRKVSQKVGARVAMPISSVDDDRRTLCSNGLHIARRDYIRTFNGDAIVLVRINPEDVISVPETETSKMRVRAYDILVRLPQAGFDLLRRNEPMTKDAECAKLLGAAIAGEYPDPVVRVDVVKELGKKLKVTKLGEEPASEVRLEAKPVEALNTDRVAANQNVKPLEGLDAKSLAKKAGEVSVSVTEAAMTGNLAAAISAPAQTKPVPPQPLKDVTRLAAEAEALRLIGEGMSQREASRVTGIPRRTIGRLIEKKA